ncbi:hydroxyacid dehydrogenase [Anaerosporomusa subterranea]|uniref:Hydroxyacid dehydrogenase n=1 Tax=Anaerosporomusa subterranea TaxID=1794912 RepID=A0A154BU24_ANASB|nr:NAD(P)-dependent oxidoreductase [Anaerosporomusa subterranea]KYZ77397.1 hydroxyacid dehydrogenase [Anaerosporomusa subterranea]
MTNTVVLNAGKLDFDHKLDYSPLNQLTVLTKYEASNDQEIIERVQNQDIVITKELAVGRELILQFPPSVKLICEAGTGYNNIDIAAAREKNITVCNVPGYSTEAVAQLAIACMLNLSSSLSLQQTMIKQRDLSNFTKHLQVPHFEIQNKTLGLIGAGAISYQAAVVARALGMNILVYSRTPKAWNQLNAKFVTLEELLANSDFVSIHCPLTPQTKHLMNKERFQLMKPSAYIINTSRGPIINETDLIAALQNKQLAGAALDVQDPEPPALDNPLFAMDNVLLTPHIGWKTLESRQRLIGLLAGNINAYIKGIPTNIVS